jgi:hypothetical protein
MKAFLSIILLVAALFVASCAQLPPSSVTLSNSIADDLGSMQASHKEFVNFYYDGLEQRANDLMDNTYRPYLLRSVIEQDVAKFKDSSTKNQSLFNAIQEAFIDNGSMNAQQLADAQANAMAGMKDLLHKN